MLRATAQVLRPGGRTAFYVIELADGLTPAQRRRAEAGAPRAVAARRPYGHLLQRAGLTHVHEEDVTDAYLATLRLWLEHTRANEDAVAASDGRALVEERIAGWLQAADAVVSGWLRRTLYAAERPARKTG